MSYNELTANNAVSTLAANITAGATSFSVAVGEGALFPAIAGAGTDQHFVCTIDDGAGNIEIVRCRQRSVDTFLVVDRGQEGTIAKAFSGGTPIELRLTAGSMNAKIGTTRYTQSGGLRNAPGTDAIDIQATATLVSERAQGTQSIAIGNKIHSAGAYDVGLGSSIVSASHAVARNIRIGHNHAAAGNMAYGISIGSTITNGGYRNHIVGRQSNHPSPHGQQNLIFGSYNTVAALSEDCIVIGNSSNSAGGNHNILLGNDLVSGYGITLAGDWGLFLLGASPSVMRGNILSGAAPHSRLLFSGTPWLYVSPTVSLTSAADYDMTPSFPAPVPANRYGVRAFVDEVGVFLVPAPLDGFMAEPSITTLPEVAFGFGGTGSELLASVALSGISLNSHRQRFTSLLTDHGSSTFGYRVTVAGTGTIHGRFYFRGWTAGV